MKEQLSLQIKAAEQNFPSSIIPVIKKLANISSLEFVNETDDAAVTFMVKTTEYAIPLGNLIDPQAEKVKLEEELNYLKGFATSVGKKLENKRFVENAPEAVVAKEKQKLADAEIKMKAVTEQLSKIK